MPTALSGTASTVLTATVERDQGVLLGLMVVAVRGATEGMVQVPCGRTRGIVRVSCGRGCGVVTVGGFIVVAVAAAVMLPVHCSWSCCDVGLDTFRCLPEKNGCIVLRVGMVLPVAEIVVVQEATGATRAATPSDSDVSVVTVSWE